MLHHIVPVAEDERTARHWRVFVDGSCLGNHRTDRNARSSGYGIWFESNQWSRNRPLGPPHTNNRAELTAAVVLLEAVLAGVTPVKPTDHLHVIGDNRYVVDAASSWIEQWKARGWTTVTGDPVKNQDLMMRFDRAIQRFRQQRRPLTVQWTPAHQREPKDPNSANWLDWFGNDRADALAKQAAKQAFDDKGDTGSLRAAGGKRSQ